MGAPVPLQREGLQGLLCHQHLDLWRHHRRNRWNLCMHHRGRRDLLPEWSFQRMWIILQPVIFALIGTEIQIHKINLETLGYSILVLFIALVIRMIGTYVAVMGGELNVKEMSS